MLMFDRSAAPVYSAPVHTLTRIRVQCTYRRELWQSSTRDKAHTAQDGNAAAMTHMRPIAGRALLLCQFSSACGAGIHMEDHDSSTTTATQSIPCVCTVAAWQGPRGNSTKQNKGWPEHGEALALVAGSITRPGIANAAHPHHARSRICGNRCTTITQSRHLDVIRWHSRTRSRQQPASRAHVGARTASAREAAAYVRRSGLRFLFEDGFDDGEGEAGVLPNRCARDATP
jgi:hypothetical protein